MRRLSRLCGNTEGAATAIKTYTELSALGTFEERFEYLRLRGNVGEDTFGYLRRFNQKFYASPEWRSIRRRVILRDNGCDLGVPGRIISGKIIIHHLNPITFEDIEKMSEYLISPEYLICVSPDTHNAIHYGNADLLPEEPVFRIAGDTCPWRVPRDQPLPR